MRCSDSKLYQNKILKFLNGVDDEVNTPLYIASRFNNDSRVCEYLIQKNLETIALLKEENINEYRDGLRKLFHHKHDDGDTPIALACASGRLNCVQAITRKYDCKSELKAVPAEEYCNQIHDFVSSKNKNGLTPQHLAVKYNK
jgi:ankyrin repeat protein